MQGSTEVLGSDRVLRARTSGHRIFVKPRFDAYKAISLQIREIFAEYTPIIDPLSLDEAYLEVTENLKGIRRLLAFSSLIRPYRCCTASATLFHGFSSFGPKLAH